MSKTLILDGLDLNMRVANYVSAFMGPEAYANNYTTFLTRYINAVLYPYEQDQTTDYAGAMWLYQLTIEHVHDLVDYLGPHLRDAIMHYFASAIGHNAFDVTVKPDGTIYVVDLGRRRVGDTEYERLYHSVTKDLEDGHYVPPRYRQLAGYFG